MPATGGNPSWHKMGVVLLNYLMDKGEDHVPVTLNIVTRGKLRLRSVHQLNFRRNRQNE